MSLKPRRVDFNATWNLLKETLEGVITCGKVDRTTWNDRFSDVYKLCTALPEHHGDNLYHHTKEFLQNHVKSLLNEIRESGEESMLEMYHKFWECFNTGAGYLNQLYGYLNNTYIKKQKFSEADVNFGVFPVDSDCLLEIGELAKDIWKTDMIDPIQQKVVFLVLQEISRDRYGYDVNHRVIHSVVTSFVDVYEYKRKTPLELYQGIFEKQFITETGAYYRQEAARLKAECTCSEYLEKVIQMLNTENHRSIKFLHFTSFSKVTNEVQMRMVADLKDFFQGECHDMVINEKKKDMSNMYTLLKPIPKGLDALLEQVESHIKQQGMEAVLSLKQDPMFVEAMLKVYHKFSSLIQEVFNSDKVFLGALDKACSAVINYRPPNSKAPNRSPELLAKYCDNLLKKSTKGVGESEMDEKLHGSIVIFKYLDDKDVFQRFYSKMLAKRLIYNQSASMDLEEGMITRLKQACGYEFTNKLHRMFTDVSLSNDHVSNFNEYLRAKQISLGINFSILVFQAGAWPIGQQNSPSFLIPQHLEQSVQLFEEFYNQKFNGRKLTWMPAYSNVELKLCYLKKPYIMTMSTFQMAVLLPFESSDSLIVADILTATNLPEKELVKQLQTLVDTKLLICEDSQMSSSSLITLNKSYNNKRTRLRIMAAVQRETPQEVEITHTAVDEDRKLYLQAAIVRIMKARKAIKHNNLIQEVITQSKSRFTPSISMIKKSIENLIEKTYLERRSGTTDEYSYIA